LLIVSKFIDKTFDIVRHVKDCSPWKFIDSSWTRCAPD